MGKHQKKKASLLLGLLLSTVIFTIISVSGRFTIYEDYPLNLWEQPTLTVMFEAVKDGIYPWEMIQAATKDTEDHSDSDFVTENEDKVVVNNSEDSNIKAQEETTSNEKETLVKNQIEESKKPESEKEEPKKEEPKKEESKKEEPTKEDSTIDEVTEAVTIGEVSQDYFDDVLFIGDSRTVGLSEYSYLTNATYYCDTGLSVYTVFDKKIAKIDHKMVTLEKALKKNEFSKIYIMLGVNELGTGTATTFAAKYQEMLDRIQELEPNAEIIVQAIMKLGKELSDSDPIYNNSKIVERNTELEKLADNKKIFYLDINEVLADKEGYLPDEHTFDSIHLLAKYYDVWADYLMSHGIIENEKE